MEYNQNLFHFVGGSDIVLETVSTTNEKKEPIINFYIAAAAVLSNLKRIEVTYWPTTVAGHDNYIKAIYANHLQTCH